MHADLTLIDGFRNIYVLLPMACVAFLFIYLFTKVALKSISRDVFQQEYIQSFFVGSIFKEN